MKFELNERFEYDYPYQAAGRIWIVNTVRLVELPDGTIAIAQSELRRIHRAIANQICGAARPLSATELEFLCAITNSAYADVARSLGLHKSTVTKWIRTDGSIPTAAGLYLKKRFWFRLFGSGIGTTQVSLGLLEDENQFLNFAKTAAIDQHLTESIGEKVA